MVWVSVRVFLFVLMTLIFSLFSRASAGESSLLIGASDLQLERVSAMCILQCPLPVRARMAVYLLSLAAFAVCRSPVYCAGPALEILSEWPRALPALAAVLYT